MSMSELARARVAQREEEAKRQPVIQEEEARSTRLQTELLGQTQERTQKPERRVQNPGNRVPLR